MLTYFPRLKEREKQLAGTLSGGEQQMLTVARTLMGNPSLIMIDEPTEGLAPKIVELVADYLREIQKRGVSVLLVEQCLKPVDDRGGVVPSRSPASPQARSARQRRSEGYDPCSP